MALFDDFIINGPCSEKQLVSIKEVLWLACVFLLFLLSTEEFDYNKEERYECKGGEMFGNQRRFPGPIFWDYKVKS